MWMYCYYKELHVEPSLRFIKDGHSWLCDPNELPEVGQIGLQSYSAALDAIDRGPATQYAECLPIVAAVCNREVIDP